MFSEFFRFELRYQLRTPLLWIITLMFTAMAVLAISTDAVTLGNAIGNVHRNAPTVIVQFFGVFSLLGMLSIVSFVVSGLLRDHELGMADLFFSSPMRKKDYLFGRIVGGLVAVLIVYLGVGLGMMFGQFMPGIDPERVGTFSLKPYLYGYLVFVLPNLLFVGALLSMLAASSRSLLITYLGVIAFFVLWQITGALTRDLENLWLASLLDPFGVRAFARMTRYWTVEQRNAGLPEVTSYLLANRLLWLSFTMAMFAAIYALFKPMRANTQSKKKKLLPSDASVSNVALVSMAPLTSLILPKATRYFTRGIAWSQLWHLLWFDTRGILKSIPFLVMLVFGLVNFLGSARFIEVAFGTPAYPVTALMLEAMQGTYNFFMWIILIFYAGELIFKERVVKIHEVTDVTPIPNWVPLAAKVGALFAVIAVFLLMSALSSIGYQAANGYSTFEVGVYFKNLLLEFWVFALFAVFALSVQVYTNNKFLGYAVVIAWLIVQGTLSVLHFDHNLYNYANSPIAPYSDMNGFGHYLTGRLWFLTYWSTAALLLLAIAAAFWVRGINPTRKERFIQARQRLHGPLGATAGLLLAAFFSLGAWIFYNTNILNEYVSSDRALDRQARFEKEFSKYKNVLQPRITAITADVDLYPHEQRAEIRGHYHLINKNNKPIDEFHIQFIPKFDLISVNFAPNKLALDDKELGYRIYKLDSPMMPGAEMDFDFTVRLKQTGFENGIGQTQVVDNGTFFNSAQAFPNFGFNHIKHDEILDRNERRKRGLGEVPRMPKVEDESARANTYISHDADWVQFETTVSTEPDQIALAPGYLQREWNENSRHYFHYKMDVPMLPLFSYQSARYEVKRDSWKNIPIEIYYDKKHPYNIDRMIQGVKDTLTYTEANFTPYQHKQVRILEFPRYDRFAQSFANTIPFSEAMGFIADQRDPDKTDFPYLVTAHEVAHQWWAHQVIGGDMQGSTMLSESLAHYSALMVMKHRYGEEKMRKFLKYELDRYLRERGSELVEELPLYRVENQGYIHYRKGAVTLYRLADEIGEENLNRALKKFLEEKRFQPPPYPTSAELLTYIREETPAEKQTLITDLFEKIVLYDIRATQAKVQKRPDGKYDVELSYEANKFEANGKGSETEISFNDEVDIGVFARKSGAKENDEKVIYLKKQQITQKKGSIKLIVDSEPYEVGVDPYNKLIDRISDDNRTKVELVQ